MKIEYDSRVPSGARRYICFKCDSRYLAEKEGVDWFERDRKYLGKQYISYCPVCGTENRQWDIQKD